MKTKPKTKNTTKRKASEKPGTSFKSVAMVRTKRAGLRHFRLVANKHTGKLIHHRHTSHLALAVILLVVGLFMYASEKAVSAETQSGTVSVGVVIGGPAPTIGATITSPTDGTDVIDLNTIEIQGTCSAGAFVVISDNSAPVGSMTCTDAGVFGLIVQLYIGTNVISALNYDNGNQSGPATPSITINMFQNSTNPETSEAVTPVLPINPSIIPGITTDLTDCNNYDAPTTLSSGGPLHVVVACVPRLFNPGLRQTLGILVWGGTPPYAISIDWDNDSAGDTLLIMQAPGYKTETFNYTISGIYKVSFMLKDTVGKTAVVQTSVQVNGTPASSSNTNNINDIDTQWLKTPVPLYVMAVAITLGFWGGDIFDRKFGSSKNRRKSRRKSA